jgi:hypothetical protein
MTAAEAAATDATRLVKHGSTGRPAPPPAFFVSAEVFLLQLSPRTLGASFCAQLRECRNAPRSSVLKAGNDDSEIDWGCSPSHSTGRAQASFLAELTERTDARVCHRCRDGAWSGRCMGGSGAARRLSSECGARARGHVVKGHVARSAPSHMRSTTARTGGQTTEGRSGCRSCIPETATELSSVAWIIGQRNRAAR